MITSGMMSSNTAEWATPQKLFDELNAEFSFDLDPCCTHENAKCEKHYTKAENGLSQMWGGIEFTVIPLTAERLQNGLKKLLRVTPL